GASSRHRQSPRHGGVRRAIQTAVGEAVGGDVQHAHDERPCAEVERPAVTERNRVRTPHGQGGFQDWTGRQERRSGGAEERRNGGKEKRTGGWRMEDGGW